MNTSMYHVVLSVYWKEHVLLSLVVIIHNSAGKTQSGVLFIWRNFIHLSHHFCNGSELVQIHVNNFRILH